MTIDWHSLEEMKILCDLIIIRPQSQVSLLITGIGIIFTIVKIILMLIRILRQV